VRKYVKIRIITYDIDDNVIIHIITTQPNASDNIMGVHIDHRRFRVTNIDIDHMYWQFSFESMIILEYLRAPPGSDTFPVNQ
jgi:hypothetical protein